MLLCWWGGSMNPPTRMMDYLALVNGWKPQTNAKNIYLTCCDDSRCVFHISRIPCSAKFFIICIECTQERRYFKKITHVKGEGW